MQVDDTNYPNLRTAFWSIECNSGGHLIGTVYPGQKMDLDRFKVPEAWAHLVPGAERGLARLKDFCPTDLETFTIGEQSEADEIETRQGDLAEARILLNDYFEGWPAECAPFAGKGA